MKVIVTVSQARGLPRCRSTKSRNSAKRARRQPLSALELVVVASALTPARPLIAWRRDDVTIQCSKEIVATMMFTAKNATIGQV